MIFSYSSSLLFATLLVVGVVASKDTLGTNSSKTTKDEGDGIVVPPFTPTEEEMQADNGVGGVQDDDAVDSAESTEVIPENAKDLHERDLEAERRAFQKEQEEFEKELQDLEKLKAALDELKTKFELKKQMDDDEKKVRVQQLKEEEDILEGKMKALEDEEKELLKERGKLDLEEATLSQDETDTSKQEEELKKKQEELSISEQQLEVRKRTLKDNKTEWEKSADLREYEKELQKEYVMCGDFPDIMREAYEENMGRSIEGAKICYKKKE